MDTGVAILLQESESSESLLIPNSSSCFKVKKEQNNGENFGESFGQSQTAGKKRRLTDDQVLLLERNFNDGNKLEHERKVQLAKDIGLQPRQVAVWFQNRRARSKTKKIENEHSTLTFEYEKLKKAYDDLANEHKELKAEVDELREKWATVEKMRNDFKPLEVMDSSVTEFGKSNTSTMGEMLSNDIVQTGSSRPEEGSGSSSKSDAFYSESSPVMENQSHSNFLQDEEDNLGGELGLLEEGVSVYELMDSYHFISTENLPFCFWPS